MNQTTRHELRRSSSVLPRLGTLGATCVLGISLLIPVVRAQAPEDARQALAVSTSYTVTPNITYLTANNWEAKLDVYRPRGLKEPNPTLIYIHGGGWVGGSKEAASLIFLPYLTMGWSVVNVEYRLGRVSLAPAAVEDCRCALAWVIQNAEKYLFDTKKLVVTGNSAGGHLSLTTGMLPTSAGLDRQCHPREKLEVAAIINWYGITDVGDLLEGNNEKYYAVRWMASLPDRMEIAERVSPLNYVRDGLPPILTIHGDKDTIVPYSHAVRLHEALDRAGLANQLHTVPGGGHGGFTRQQHIDAFEAIHGFLMRHNLMPSPRPSR